MDVAVRVGEEVGLEVGGVAVGTGVHALRGGPGVRTRVVARPHEARRVHCVGVGGIGLEPAHHRIVVDVDEAYLCVGIDAAFEQAQPLLRGGALVGHVVVCVAASPIVWCGGVLDVLVDVAVPLA